MVWFGHGQTGRPTFWPLRSVFPLGCVSLREALFGATRAPCSSKVAAFSEMVASERCEGLGNGDVPVRRAVVGHACQLMTRGFHES